MSKGELRGGEVLALYPFDNHRNRRQLNTTSPGTYRFHFFMYIYLNISLIVHLIFTNSATGDDDVFRY